MNSIIIIIIFCLTLFQTELKLVLLQQERVCLKERYQR